MKAVADKFAGKYKKDKLILIKTIILYGWKLRINQGNNNL